MIYGYVRVSTDKQTVDNQRFEIERFCELQSVNVNINSNSFKWIEETVSGTLEPSKRLLGGILDNIHKGDLIICSELSRLGRSLFMIMSILNLLMEKGARVWTIKDNFRLGDDIQSKVLAFAFGISAEIERSLISQRTKEALILRKSEGIVLGRPKGSIAASRYLDGTESHVRLLLESSMTFTAISKHLGINRITLKRFINQIENSGVKSA